MFFDLFGAYLEGGAVGSTKGCARVCHYKMHDKSHPELCDIVGERNSEHGFVELG